MDVEIISSSEVISAHCVQARARDSGVDEESAELGESFFVVKSVDVGGVWAVAEHLQRGPKARMVARCVERRGHRDVTYCASAGRKVIRIPNFRGDNEEGGVSDMAEDAEYVSSGGSSDGFLFCLSWVLHVF